MSDSVQFIRGRPNSRSKSHVRTKRALRCLLVAVVLCAAINTATLASIGYHISVRRETLVDVFNASMRLYVSAASYKYAIDEIQFALQCCGHTSYTDWFRFDWQVSFRRCLKPASIVVSPKAFAFPQERTMTDFVSVIASI